MYILYFIELPVYFKKKDAICDEDIYEPDIKNHEIGRRTFEIGEIRGYHETQNKLYTWIDGPSGNWCVNMKYDVFCVFFEKHVEKYHSLGRKNIQRGLADSSESS